MENELIPPMFKNIPEPSTGWVTKPYPKALFRIENEGDSIDFDKTLMNVDILGACAHSENLHRVIIPNTVGELGKHTFKETKIKSITIPEDCTYYEDSFPEGDVKYPLNKKKQFRKTP